ncbi:MAG: adenosine deaminase [Candidatus Cloacimonadota bacterium]|nr:adenosine deaminase [Candidatus Cloacimonadota bacterium]
MREKIKKMPKTDLHLHLDGSLRIDTILQLAEKNRVKLPAREWESLQEYICCDEKCESLEEYLQGFTVTCSVMQTKEALHRVALELVEDVAAENVRYMEVRYSPILHVEQGLSFEEVNEAVIAGLKEGEAKFKVKSGVIICGLRHMKSSTSYDLAKLAVKYKNKGVVGYDLAGAEAGFPAIEHKKAFELVQQHNMNITVHAGEAAGAESIKQALHICGAHRIGHGTRLYEDEDLLNYVNDHRIALEVCLVSNLQTKAVQKLADHPAKDYLEKGLRVTLNTDNRLISNTTLTDEYMTAVKEFGWDWNQLKQVVLNGFVSAFLPFREKEKLLEQVIEELEDLE